MKLIKLRKLDFLTNYVPISNEYRRQFLLSNLENFCHKSNVEFNKHILIRNRKHDIIHVTNWEMNNLVFLINEHNKKVSFERRFKELLK